MDAIMAVILFRSLERNLIIAGAILSIFLGWSLFKLPLSNEGEASIQYKNLQLALRRIGPGIFFSLFGSVILGLSFVYPIHLSADSKDFKKSDKSDNLSRWVAFEFSGASEDKDKSYKKLVLGINTAINSASEGDDPNTIKASIKDLAEAKPHLISARNWLHDYDKIYNEWWHLCREGGKDVAWKGKINYFALSSGTSGLLVNIFQFQMK